MATTGLAISFSTAVKRYGATRAVEMFQEYNDAIDTIEKLVRDNGIDCDYNRFGKLSLAFHKSHYEGFLKSQEKLATLANHHVTVIPKSEIHSEIRSGPVFTWASSFMAWPELLLPPEPIFARTLR
jgi:hypothetical protein